MGVTFRKYNGDTSTDVTLHAKELKRTFTSKNEIKEIPGAEHIVIPLGKKGPMITWGGSVPTSSNYLKVNDWNNGDYLSIVDSNYPEIVSGETWYIDKVTTTRKGGSMDNWEISLTIVKVHGEVIEV